LSDGILFIKRLKFVIDFRRYSRNEVTGEVRVALGDLSVACGVEVWGEIGRQKRPQEELQELLLSLSYLPSAERLTVVVMKARNLLPPAQDGSKDTLGMILHKPYWT
jgi:synaptotagmin-6